MKKAIRHTLKKEERLYLRSEIEALFAKRSGKTFYPIRVVLNCKEEDNPTHKILISVPKKRLKHAVDRNRIKRLVREAYRLNKDILLNEERENSNKSIHIAFIYLADEVMNYSEISKAVVHALRYISQEFDSIS